VPGNQALVANGFWLLLSLLSLRGDFDLMMKLYIPDTEDVGKFINDNLLMIAGIERSLTTMTYKVF
jgi:DNA-binding Lrp family transcriptional regulator